MTFQSLPDLPSIPGDAAYAPAGSVSTTLAPLGGTSSQLQDVAPGSSINPDGSINQGNNGTINGFINYVETNIGNFAARIGVVIFGFIFIAVALTMFGDKSINNVIRGIK